MEKMFDYQIFLNRPVSFSPQMEAAGCYCTHGDRVLLVKRQSFKSQGNKWGVPAGKLEKDEDPITAVRREMKEEIGLEIDLKTLQKIDTLFIRLHNLEYIFHMYFARFASLPQINLDLSENQEARWTTIQDALALPLVIAGKEALDHYQNFLSQTMKSEPYTA